MNHHSINSSSYRGNRYYGGISTLLHPDWIEVTEWMKWRSAYEGGRQFINLYLQKMSSRESDPDLQIRKNMAYCPRFAGIAIDEIKNSIYQRMVDIKRIDGPTSYQEAISGKLGGVDYDASDMNTFIGTQVLKELITMKTVGVMVDAPKYQGTTLLDKGDKHPFLCLYPRESIKSYSFTLKDNVKVLQNVLLEEEVDEVDEEFGLLCGITTRLRLIKLLDNGKINVSFYDGNSLLSDSIDVDIPYIPFHIFEIDRSLMETIADYQIALLNMESADVSYALKSNFPQYYEFFDKQTEPLHLKSFSPPGEDGSNSSQNVSKDPEKAVGSHLGRRFPAGIEKPGYINPSPDTLTVSMKKEEQIKNDIRRLANLNLIAATEKLQSADSKREDSRSLDSALSAIGLILQKGENELGRFWAYFEGQSVAPTVIYPQNYSLKSEEDRQVEAENLEKRMVKLPSKKYKKEIAKEIATITMGHKLEKDVLETIHKEIDVSDVLITDPDQILLAQLQGLVDDVTASSALGFDGEKVIPLAKKDRAERIALTLAQQQSPGGGAARGAPELGGPSSKDEKVGKPVRGDGQKVAPNGPPGGNS